MLQRITDLECFILIKCVWVEVFALNTLSANPKKMVKHTQIFVWVCLSILWGWPNVDIQCTCVINLQKNLVFSEQPAFGISEFHIANESNYTIAHHKVVTSFKYCEDGNSLIPILVKNMVVAILLSCLGQVTKLLSQFLTWSSKTKINKQTNVFDFVQ